MKLSDARRIYRSAKFCEANGLDSDARAIFRYRMEIATLEDERESAHAERAKLLEAFGNLVESVSERHHWSQFAGTDLVVPKDAFEDARSFLESLKAKP